MKTCRYFGMTVELFQEHFHAVISNFIFLEIPIFKNNQHTYLSLNVFALVIYEKIIHLILF